MANNLKGFFQGIKQNWGKNKLLIWLLGAAGVILLILPSLLPSRGEEPPPQMPAVGQENHQEQLRRELESILSSIQGVGKVRVMLTLEDQQEVIYARNEQESRRTIQEEDNAGGIREQVEYDYSGQLVIVRTQGYEEPVVERIIKPRVRGVLVVATNGDNPWIRESLTQAVQSVLDVPAYRITIQKGR
jgi:stage III sporulation protein AG